MHPTPLRGPKIAAILKVGFTRQFARSISAARVMGNPLGGNASKLVLFERDILRRLPRSGLFYDRHFLESWYSDYLVITPARPDWLRHACYRCRRYASRHRAVPSNRFSLQ